MVQRNPELNPNLVKLLLLMTASKLTFPSETDMVTIWFLKLILNV